MASLGVSRISRFIEKPALGTAENLILRGGLWNTMVMVFRASTLLHLLRRHFSAIYSHFQRIKEAIGSPFEKAVVQETYSGMAPVNFSRDMLQLFTLQHPSRFLVLPVRGVLWSDWGSEYRVTDTLKKIGYLEQSPRAFKEKLIDTGVGSEARRPGWRTTPNPEQKQIGEKQAELQEVRRENGSTIQME